MFVLFCFRICHLTRSINTTVHSPLFFSLDFHLLMCVSPDPSQLTDFSHNDGPIFPASKPQVSSRTARLSAFSRSSTNGASIVTKSATKVVGGKSGGRLRRRVSADGKGKPLVTRSSTVPEQQLSHRPRRRDERPVLVSSSESTKFVFLLLSLDLRENWATRRRRDSTCYCVYRSLSALPECYVREGW